MIHSRRKSKKKNSRETPLGSIHFLEGGWAGGIQGRVINLPKKGGSAYFTQQRGRSPKFFLKLYKFTQTDL